MISAERAGQMFGELCVQHAPTFAGTEGTAAGYGFVQYTVYGNYFHPRENLSVALVDGDCAMTFASSDDPLDIEAALIDGLSLVTEEGQAANLSADFRRRPMSHFRATLSTGQGQAGASQPGSGSGADHAASRSDCASPPTPALRVRACTQAIESGTLGTQELANAYNLRGVAHVAMGESRQAIEDLTEAIRLNPQLARAYLNRGAAYFYTGQRQLALADLDEAIRLDPRADAGYFNRGSLYLELGDPDRALDDLNEAIRLRPDHDRAYVMRANIFTALGEFDRAEQDHVTAERLARGPATAASLRRSPDAAPGSRPITVARAEEIFADVCVRQAPSFDGIEAQAASYGFVQHTTYGTFYHPRQNLSVKLVRGECSMVFASNDDPGALEQALTSLGSQGASIQFEQGQYVDGTQYYNVRVG